MKYRLLHNVGEEKSFLEGYRPGDTLVVGFEGNIDSPATVSVEALDSLAELVFYRHNRDDRPDAHESPSLSVGDIIVFGEVAFSVLPIGFAQVFVDTEDILDISFIDFISGT